MHRSVLRLLSATGLVALLPLSSPGPGLHFHPIRVLHRSGNQVYSGNWSGYAVAKWETGQSYTAVSGTWTVPAVPAGGDYYNGYSSSWVGIGGFLLNSSGTRVDKTLIQTGTAQDESAGGTSSYYAWYELLPNPPVQIPLTVSPGDRISASVQEVAAGKKNAAATWEITLADESTGQFYDTRVQYKSSLASAEWIEEAPSGTTGILPLADFGQVPFDHGTVNAGQNPALAETQAILLQDPNGQVAAPSVPDTDTDGFVDYFGASTLNQTAPAS